MATSIRHQQWMAIEKLKKELKLGLDTLPFIYADDPDADSLNDRGVTKVYKILGRQPYRWLPGPYKDKEEERRMKRYVLMKEKETADM